MADIFSTISETNRQHSIARLQKIGNIIIERGEEELRRRVTDFAVIRIEALFDNKLKIIWLFNRDSEGQQNLRWLPSVSGNVSTSKHRALGSFLLQNRFEGGTFNGQKVEVHDISYYKYEAPHGKYDAVLGKTELSETEHVQFKSLRAFLKDLAAGNKSAELETKVKELEKKSLPGAELEKQAAELIARYAIQEQEVLDLLQETQRYIRDTNALRLHPALDSAQTRIKDSRIWDGVLIIDGGPGTGKTTTLIQRVNFLTQKAALSERRPDIPDAILNDLEGDSGWLFISPTESLKAYLQNAMAEEGLSAGNTKMKAWFSHLDELFRAYGLFLPTTQKKSPFTKSRNKIQVFPNDWKVVSSVIALFDSYTINIFKKRAQTSLTPLEHRDLNMLRQQLENSIKRINDIGSWIDLYLFLNSLRKDYVQNFNTFSKELAELLNKDAAQVTALIKSSNNELYLAIGAWTKTEIQENIDNPDDLSDPEEDPDESEESKAEDLEAKVFKNLKTFIKDAALLSLKKGYSVKSSSQKDLIGKMDTYLLKDNFKRIGEIAILQNAYKSWIAGGDSQLLNKIPTIYKKFRKAIVQGDLITDTGIKESFKTVIGTGTDKLLSDEMHFLFAWINRKVKLIASRFPNFVQEPEQKYAQAYADSFRYNIVVDEASDFSLIELLAMDSLTHWQYKSMTLCGDLMQRMTKTGLKDWEPFLESVDHQGEVHELKVSYRQTPTLLRIASAFYQQVTGRTANYSAYSKPSPNEPIPWVKQCADPGQNANWLSERIIEIHTAYGGNTPSIAIFCNDDDAVRQTTRLLKENDNLYDIGINVQGVDSQVAMVDASKVCVYNIQNIKGLEFEAVFFVDVDELDQRDPDLLKKYLYVGLSRAAFYLGITYNKTLPEEIQAVLNFE